jgi:hypothetical protein
MRCSQEPDSQSNEDNDLALSSTQHLFQNKTDVPPFDSSIKSHHRQGLTVQKKTDEY